MQSSLALHSPFTRPDSVCTPAQITPDVVVIDNYSGRPGAFETRTDPERGTRGAFLYEEEIDSLPPEDTDNIFVHQLLSDSKFINRISSRRNEREPRMTNPKLGRQMATSGDKIEPRATNGRTIVSLFYRIFETASVHWLQKVCTRRFLIVQKCTEAV
jgi:hypothetical protein